MENTINIAIDTETLSLKPNAIITQIAAKQFSFDETINYPLEFKANINIVPNLIQDNYGFDIDENTLSWWKHQPAEAKKQFEDINATTLKNALMSLNYFIEDCKKNHETERLQIWMEGTDFDGAVLKNAYCQSFPDKYKQNYLIPWNYRDLRDSRTCIMEWYNLFHPEGIEDYSIPYSIIPKKAHVNTVHDALYDVNTLIDNMKFIYKDMHQKLNIKKS